MGMRIFIAVTLPYGADSEWQVEVCLSTCRVRIHRKGRQVATARHSAGAWIDIEPDNGEIRGVLDCAEDELKPFAGLLKHKCGGAAGA